MMVRSALCTLSPRSARLCHDPSQKDAAVDPRVGLVGVREVVADVAQARGPEQGVAQGVEATSPSEWAASPWSWGTVTPHRIRGRPDAKR